MLKIEDLRRKKLELAVDLAGGTLEALADKALLSAAYLSQVRNGLPDTRTGRPKNLGSRAARKIESAIGQPEGWMDHDDETEATAQEARHHIQTGAGQSEDNAAAVSKAGLPHPSPATKRLLSLIKGRSERQILRITKALEMLFEASEKEQPEEDELVVHLGKRRQLDSSRNANHHK